jgi:hypothetical protein
MLPNLNEIYEDEKVGGCYLIFDVSLDSIPADLFKHFDSTTVVELGTQRMMFFGAMADNTTSVSFEITGPLPPPQPQIRTISFKIVQKDPILEKFNVIVEDLFDIVCDMDWKPISVDFYYNTIDAIDRCYRIPQIEGTVYWVFNGQTPYIWGFKDIFSLIDISPNIPIWETNAVDPVRYSPLDTLDNVSMIPGFDLSKCALSFNRDIAVNSISSGSYNWGDASYIEEPFKWRLSMFKATPATETTIALNKLIFEYLSNKGERVVEEWWNGTEWTIPEGLIDMGKYGIPLIIKERARAERLAFCSVVEVLSRMRSPSTDYATALVLVQEAALRMGLSIPQTIQPVIEADKSVIDKNTQLLLGGLNSIAYYSTTLYDWPSMKIDGTYEVIDDNVASLDTQVIFPGYDKMITDGFLCNMTDNRTVKIQQCNEDRYIEILNLPANEVHRIDDEGYNVYVQRGNNICFARPLKKGSVLHCVYKTRFPVIDAIEGIPVPRFSNDKDLSYIDSELLVIGTVLNYKSYIGDDYRKEAQVFDEYAKYLKSTRSSNRIKRETESIPYMGRPDLVRIM